MTHSAFQFASLALLAAPGPTNALLALAGAGSGGWRRASRLVPVALAAYLLVVVPLALAGAGLAERLPLLAQAVKLGAAAWVMVLAIRLWTLPAGDAASSVSARQVFVTTLLNPKALVFGLVLLPAGGGFPLRLAEFALLVVAAAGLWIAIGAGSARSSGRTAGTPPWLQRVVASWLALVSAGLAAGALHG